MAIAAGDLVVSLTAKVDQFSSQLSRAEKSIASLERGLNSAKSGLSGFAATMASFGGNVLASGFQMGISSVKDMAVSVVKLAADAEVARIELDVLTGNAGKGAKIFEDLEKFAARTSFNVESAAEASRLLLAKGVGDNQLLPTLEMLGNLAMGDSERLKLLSKAYSDVQAKGKLAAQETNQFAENGVNLMQMLSDTTGRTVGELLAMREAGAITFEMVQEAMVKATTQGGKFFEFTERVNKTFTGQWNSVIEGIQSFGRSIGELVLPRMKDWLTEINRVVTAVNAMPDKFQFVTDMIGAAWDVATLTIRVKWAEMLKDMLEATKKFAIENAVELLPGARFAANQFAKPPNAKPAEQQLAEAQQRFADLLKRLEQPPGGANAPQQQQPQIADLLNGKRGGPDLGAAIGNAWEKLQGPIDAVKGNVFGIFEMQKTKLSNWFGSIGDWLSADPQKQSQPQLAAGMERTDASAWSTIVQAMIRRSDPQLKETQKIAKQSQKTNEHLAAMRANAGLVVVGDIA